MRLAPTEVAILEAVKRIEEDEIRPATTHEIRVACRPAEIEGSLAELEVAGFLDAIGRDGFRLSSTGVDRLDEARTQSRNR